MELIIVIILIAQGFMSGYVYGSEFEWASTKSEKIITAIWCVGTLLIGIPYIILRGFIIGILLAFKYIDGIFQIAFFFQWHFSKKWHNINKRALVTMDRIAKNHKDPKKFADRQWLKGWEKIKKINNYNSENNTLDF